MPTDNGNGRLGWSQAALRHGAYAVVQRIPLVGFVNAFIPLMNAKRQGIHDMICATQVVMSQ